MKLIIQRQECRGTIVEYIEVRCQEPEHIIDWLRRGEDDRN